MSKFLKDLSEKQSKGKKPSKSEPDEMDKIKQSMMADEAISGSFYFIFGAMFSWMKLNDIEPPPPDEFMKEFKNLNSVDVDNKEEYLKDSNNKIHKFLYWYFVECR